MYIFTGIHIHTVIIIVMFTNCRLILCICTGWAVNRGTLYRYSIPYCVCISSSRKTRKIITVTWPNTCLRWGRGKTLVWSIRTKTNWFSGQTGRCNYENGYVELLIVTDLRVFITRTGSWCGHSALKGTLHSRWDLFGSLLGTLNNNQFSYHFWGFSFLFGFVVLGVA